MSKKFNIHDWQAKQRQQNLNEAQYGKYFGKDDAPKKLNIDGDVERKINNFIKNMADDLDIPLQSVVYNIIRVIKSQNYDGVSEHHNDEDFPGKDLSAWDLLDKLKAGNKELYNKVEDFMKSMKETNSLGSAGAGASFQAGNSDAYATPNAFGDDKKKKMKAYKSIGYKKI